MALKNNVQALKNAGYISFSYDKVSGPDVISNPLPNHLGLRLNAILESPTKGGKSIIRDVMTPMKVVYEELV